MTPNDVYKLARDAGLDHEQAIIATAIAWGESGLNADAVGDVSLQDPTWGPSVGLWQVRSIKAEKGTGGTRDEDRLKDPAFNATSMVAISSRGTNWRPWTIYTNGAYKNHIDAVRNAVEAPNDRSTDRPGEAGAGHGTAVGGTDSAGGAGTGRPGEGHVVPTAKAVLDFYARNVGLTEDPPGSNHNWITDWAGLGNVPWCAETVSRALNEAWGDPDLWQVPGINPTFRWGFAYVPYLRQAFEDAGRWHATDPQPGDVVIFDWDGDGYGDHTGIFAYGIDGETCLVGEGNTSANDLSFRRRPYSLIAGFGRPPYSQEEEEDDMADPKVIELLGNIKDEAHWMNDKLQLLINAYHADQAETAVPDRLLAAVEALDKT